MLPAMTVPGVAAALLLAAALALGILLALLVAPLRARRRSRRPAPPPPALVDDDLPGFLAAPPGSAGRPAVARSGWATLGPAPLPLPAAAERAGAGRPALIAGMAALVLLAAAVTVLATAGTSSPAPAAGSGTPPTSSPTSSPSPASSSSASSSPSRAALPAVPPAPAPGDPGAGALAGTDLPAAHGGIRADLAFAGIVLERRAIGVTAAYPHVRISDEGGVALAHVELVTFNCLADAAPRNPVAAGCTRVVPQYAELTSPTLHVTRSGSGGLAVRGRFPTYVRPNGTPATWTGAVYGLRIEVTPRTPAKPGTDVPATGFLELGDGRAPATVLSVLRLER